MEQTEFYKEIDEQILNSLKEDFKDNIEHKFVHINGEIFFKLKFKTEPGIFLKVKSLFREAVCLSSFAENKAFLVISYHTLQYCYHVFIQQFSDNYTTVDIISNKDLIDFSKFKELKRVETFSGDF